jgi:acyl-homoserine lactone acylase PvdQ
MKRVAAAVCIAAGVLATPAAAQVQPPGTGDLGGFHNVLAVGQGGGATATEIAEHVAFGDLPPSFTNQLALYRDLAPRAPDVNAGNLGSFFKPAGFGVAASRVVDTLTPRAGVVIQIDDMNVPHVYGNSRADVYFGAGYVSGVMRMFQMDVLRHYARGTLTGFAGGSASNLELDVQQLRSADYTEAELQKMIDTAAAAAGQEGAEIKQDLLEYVSGINAYIADVGGNPLAAPGEYALLGQPLEDWKPTDTAAIASLIGGLFGYGGGVETRDAAALSAARARFGARRGARVWSDFRSINDPEAPVTTPRRFPFSDPRVGRGKAARKLRRQAVAIPDPGSLQEYDIVVSGRSTSQSRAAAKAGGLNDLIEGDFRMRGPSSNATLIGASESVSGRPLAVMGPQVSYYSPQILFEMDLHGGGIDTRGVAFPGISLYVLLGRGKDFTWSATTATTDNIDEFVERLCEPNGSAPTRASTHYVYNGDCVPMVVQERTVRTRARPRPTPRRRRATSSTGSFAPFTGRCAGPRP